MANRYLSHGEAYPIKTPLSEFPITMNEWEGVEVGLEPNILTILGATEVLMRRYVTHPTPSANYPTPSVWLYIGYYQSQREGKTYHSPKNCLPGSGWQIIKSERISIPIGVNRTAMINKVLIQKGLEKEMVLYWYQDRGRVIASEYWAKIYMVYDAVTRNRTDGAMVRISVAVNDSEEKTFQYMTGFVHKAFLNLGKYLPG